MPAHPFPLKSRYSIRAARALKFIAWITPFLVVWVAALFVLRAGALSTNCATMCLLARGWLWYTVFYATLSLSAFVGAFEIMIWMKRLPSVGRSSTASPNH